MRAAVSLLPFLLCVRAFTMFSSVGGEYEVSRNLVMNLDSRMTCLYETLQRNMKLRLNLESMRESTTLLSMRLTSPSGAFSEWNSGLYELDVEHNVTEDGDYEICIASPRPEQVTLFIFFHDPDKVEEKIDKLIESRELGEGLKKTLGGMAKRLFEIFSYIKTYNKISVYDEARQQSNSDYIRAYVVIFCITNIIVGVVQVAIIHKMFFIDPKKIRV